MPEPYLSAEQIEEMRDDAQAGRTGSVRERRLADHLHKLIDVCEQQRRHLATLGGFLREALDSPEPPLEPDRDTEWARKVRQTLRRLGLD